MHGHRDEKRRSRKRPHHSLVEAPMQVAEGDGQPGEEVTPETAEVQKLAEGEVQEQKA